MLGQLCPCAVFIVFDKVVFDAIFRSESTNELKKVPGIVWLIIYITCESFVGIVEQKPCTDPAYANIHFGCLLI